MFFWKQGDSLGENAHRLLGLWRCCGGMIDKPVGILVDFAEALDAAEHDARDMTGAGRLRTVDSLRTHQTTSNRTGHARNRIRVVTYV